MSEPGPTRDGPDRRAEGRRRARCGRSGDYHRFATHTVWELGPVLVEACGIVRLARARCRCGLGERRAPRRRVRARDVVASDLTPREPRRRAARGPRSAASSSTGSRPMLRHSRSATATSTSSPRRSGRSSRRTTGRVADEMLARLPAGGDDRDDQLQARGLGGRVLRATGALRAAPAARSAAADALGDENHVRELVRAIARGARAHTSRGMSSGRASPAATT